MSDVACHHRHLRRRRRPGAPQAAARALQPARRRPAAAEIRDRRRRPQGDDRRGVSRRSPRTASRSSRAAPIDEQAWADIRAVAVLRQRAEIDGEQGLRAARRAARHRSSTSAACRQPHLLPGASRPSLFVPTVKQLAARPLRRPAATVRSARLIVEKPIGHDLRQRLRDQRRDRRGVRRAADLPDRSLPRQGDRPEHPGPALRQQHLRAAVQPEIRRPRADHGGRGRRRRHAGRLLRAGRRAARHGAEPHAAAAVAGGDGAAALARRRRRSATRSWRSSAVAAADSRRGVDAQVVRGQYVARRRRRRPGYRDEKGVDPTSRTETFVALQVFIDNWRWCGRPVLPAHRQAAAQARERDLDPPEGACRRSSSTPIPARRSSRTSSSIRIQPDEGFCAGHQLASVPGPHVRRHRR